MTASADFSDEDSRTGIASLVYDPKARGLFFQVILLALVIATFVSIIDNTITNLAAQGKKSGFGFLNGESGFQILTTLGSYAVNYTAGVSSYLDVFWLGVINTLIVAALGIIAATILGFIMGVCRLSTNIVLNGFATVYVELLRNIPLLLQIFFWYFFVLRLLPGPRDVPITVFPGLAGLNISGLYMPFPVPLEGFDTVLLALAAAAVLVYIIRFLALKRQEATGKQFPTFWVGLGLLIAIPLVTHFYMGRPLDWEIPNFVSEGPVLRRGYESGFGMVVKPEFIALWLALSLYTAAFIAEIVRAGILAVPKGQTEASNALGISPGRTLSLVVIPQALRVIIPPLTSQYLNLTKNSSLAVAIAYPDIVSVFAGTALNQVGQEVEMIFMMMMVYLAISLGTSAFMNWFNDRMKLVER